MDFNNCTRSRQLQADNLAEAARFLARCDERPAHELVYHWADSADYHLTVAVKYGLSDPEILEPLKRKIRIHLIGRS